MVKNNMDFEQACEALRNGKRIRRSEWEEGRYLVSTNDLSMILDEDRLLRTSKEITLDALTKEGKNSLDWKLYKTEDDYDDIDELMKESFCSCGRPWSAQHWGNLGTVNVCFHGSLENYNYKTTSPFMGAGTNVGTCLSTSADEIGKQLMAAGFPDHFSNRIVYELGFKNGQRENIPYTACLNREKQFVDNTKNAAQELRSLLNLVFNGDPTKRHNMCSCPDCEHYKQLMIIIGKMERYEYGKTN